VECYNRCHADPLCFHWVYNCHNLDCHYYGAGGYAEDDSPQFGRDYMFLGETVHYQRRLKKEL